MLDDPILQQATADLAIAVTKNTAQTIRDRIRTSKAAKKDSETVEELQQIISELIDDKNDLIGIAQTYKSQLVSQQLSEDDINYITENVMPIINTLAESQDENASQAINLLEPILSIEMISILQLLGFNFRKAIGEPLTELANSAIKKLQNNLEPSIELQILQTQREIILAEVVKDENSYKRLRQLYGHND